MDILIEFHKKPVLFTDPEAVVVCRRTDQIEEAFTRLERYRQQGFFLAGFLSYEAGYAFERCFPAPGGDFPLLMFGCYRGFSSRRITASNGPFRVEEVTPNLPRSEYDRCISTIRAHIEQGDVYQITYCIKNRFAFTGSSYALYRTLLKRQPVPYPAYIHTPDFDIVSLSPELFFRKQGAHIVTQPMKGTWPRGEHFLQDCVAGVRLKYDRKNRAENIMIADLLRNDLGKFCTRVRAPRLFEVARYATLYQMTSTVTARCNPHIGLEQIFRALFPSGSVTGAPKIRAMEIIREIEREPRDIYTGAIGYCTPDNDAFFSIPIRTLLMGGGRGDLGVGGGIVWDSTPDGEWAESRLKRAFLDEQAGS